MLNRYLMIALMIILLPMTQLFSGVHHSYVLTDHEILIDSQSSPDLGVGGNDQQDKSFIASPGLVITLFLLGSLCLFTTIVRVNRTKQLLTPVFYQSNFVV
ncbi:hypothetical protein [Oceanobacillus oncorhynchi]|uniref:hypothetical protein n=1 Tax=Oceanobacillus oncorhynchi TaxID=545501 RepID=UPI002117281E|nr:hypothetical protein [Oceanobacillus oncorhynchi]UUI40737.1 hypothetical protein NP440_03880 [Oceanobacillus oncorhynchi]